ncbi:MAG: hypothetical protein CIT01_07560 [Methanobacterium sp. BRmetb2]|nr:MAG: hypothetical protein CIT01_07560 [Methanobacterium sp. BRmetb2]
MSNEDLPELLAPAGSYDAFKAAVNAGADAVYLSGKRFGARRFANNFSKSQIEEAVNYAHLHNVNIYVTVNTLIKNSEISKAVEHLFWLYKIGADAVIVQDVGLASLAHEIIPELDLHASTQMAIHNLPGVEWASDFGFKRVVLAREMKLSEIENIAQKLQKRVEMEIFAHGALCYSYSGRCLLSSLIGARSGNRGMCAQPCRKPYKLINGNMDQYGRPVDICEVHLENDYLLSTRDLALYNNLDVIAQKSIDSIKIEGRMRSPEYVAIVVSVYRKALDEIREGVWKPKPDDLKKLELAFNRMFTSGYILEKDHSQIMGRNRPDKRGIYIGRVINYNSKLKKAFIYLKGSIVPSKGDGIVFIIPGDLKSQGMNIDYNPPINNNILELKVKNYLPKGSKVYLNYKKSLFNEAKAIILNDHARSVPLDLKVSWDKNDTPLLEGQISGKNNSKISFRMESDFKMEKALKNPLTEKKIEKQLKKTGSTSFKIRKLEVDYPGDLFSPISQLNQIRRDFLEKTKTILLESYLPSKNEVKKSEEHLNRLKYNKFNPKHKTAISKEKEDLENSISMAIYINNPQNVEYAVESGCKRIYFESNSLEILRGKKYECLDADYLENALNRFLKMFIKMKSICDDNGAELIWKWPSINRKTYLKMALPLIDSLQKNSITEVMVGDLGSAYLLSKLKPEITLSAAAELNIWNNWTVNYFLNIFKTITFSPELSKNSITGLTKYNKLNTSNMGNNRVELLVHGNMEVIITEDCLPCAVPGFENNKEIIVPEKFWGLKDNKNHIFPFYLDLECKTHILNSVELCLVDYIPLFNQLNVDGLVIDARNREGKYVGNLLNLYQNAIHRADNGELSHEHIKNLKSRIKKMALGGITKSNFLRDVK